MFQKGDLIVYGNMGVCRVEGCAVFVPNAAPGEEYDLRIEHVGKNAAHGKIVHIITKSSIIFHF